MRDYTYPIHYEDGTCVHCGAKNSVIMIDKFGDESKNKYNPLSHMKCKKCGREYMIMWLDDDDTCFTKPVPVSKNYIDLFAQIVGNSEQLQQH